MRLLAMILVILGIIKLIIAYILNKSEIQNMSIMPPIDLEELTRVDPTLIEEAINISKENKDNEINLFCIKPLFRGVMLILNNRCIELEKVKDTSSIIEAQIQDYKQVISILNKLLDNIKE